MNKVISLTNIKKKFKNVKGKEVKILEDITFDVIKGESLGIIGKNGAGKSTLLKIIAGILLPSSGDISATTNNINLLTLGSGLIPECTGRANAVMLLMLQQNLSKKQARKAVDHVLKFGELENFADLPVYKYSSGMKSRLKFSISTQMHSDVLLIDEVFSVGDISFKKKSQKEMRKKLSSGDTIVWVSHNLKEISKFCDRVVWIENGRVVKQGSSKDIVRDYKEYWESQYKK